MRVLLQLPEGLKAEACRLARKLESAGDEIIISASPCFGACDLALREAEAVGAKKIIHCGHAEFPFPKKNKPKIPVEYVEFPSEIKLAPVLALALADPDFRKCKKVGVVTTVQHVKKIGEIKRLLESAGKTVLVGRRGPRAKYDGQILGCDVGAAASVGKKSDCILYVGGGLFHPIGVAVSTELRVLAADPFQGKAFWMDGAAKKFVSRRKGIMMAAASAESLGIIVSVKPGQENLEGARRLKKKLASAGKRAEILVTDFVSPEALGNFRCFGAFVCTACPRIAFDDAERFGKPMLTFEEGCELARQLNALKRDS
ncbi:MAG: diphthamide biosynthesis enzyme Dph2 [Candidatus ainarchaeum sp.]|nr:diphthamide biosynthesis enzyme Dph2 [Candidatus ainarchaeum sp.]